MALEPQEHDMHFDFLPAIINGVEAYTILLLLARLLLL